MNDLLRRLAPLATSLALALPTVACDDDGDPAPTPGSDAGTDAPTDSDEGGTPGDVAVGPEAPGDGELVVFEPGGDATCSRGTPYRFYAFGGDATKVIVDFQGGGACWSETTCGLTGAIFSEAAPTLEDVEAYWADERRDGLYDLDNPANPLNGWTLVHAPYCTGDIHWGDAVHTYGEGDGAFDINHKGYVNSVAVLDWVEANYPAVEHLFVTGCSAGAYGAIGHATMVADRFPGATVTVLADSGAGVITDTFFAQSFPNWNVDAALPQSLPGIAGNDIQDLSIEDLYVAVANAHPNMRIAQYNTAYDRDQRFYYTAMGGDGDAWGQTLRDKLAVIQSRMEHDNFRVYVAPGQIHCVLPYSFYYDRVVDGVALTDWMAQLLEGDTMPDDVTCESDECLSDPLCDACAAAEFEPFGCNWCTNWDPSEHEATTTP